MWIIVDGYNVIRRLPELRRQEAEGLEAGRAALVRLLAAYRRARGHHRITVVFDGQGGRLEPGGGRTAGIDVRFSRGGETADALIARLAQEGGGGALVVSSDREVERRAAAAGAAAVSCEAFAARLDAAAMADLKGAEGDEEEAPRPGRKKGTARRLPKAERRRAAALKRL